VLYRQLAIGAEQSTSLPYNGLDLGTLFGEWFARNQGRMGKGKPQALLSPGACMASMKSFWFL
jgi:hypothetical protein